MIPDWANKDLEQSLAEAVDSCFKQEKERKARFYVENDLTKKLEHSQSNATKQNAKWGSDIISRNEAIVLLRI